jgi:hypothetical protein
MMRRMMKTLTTLLCAALLGMAACGGKEADRAAAPVEGQPTSPAETSAPDQPPPENAAPPSGPENPPEGSAITPDDCRTAGGVFVPSTGTEPTCPEGKKLIAPVRFGIEGGLCCQQ